jgi:hypothetical protein
MPAHFVAGPLDRQHVAQAFPLVSMIVPNLTLNRWRAFAQARMAARRGGAEQGIFAVRNPAGYIHGLVFYEISEDLRQGRVLLASNLIAAESVGRDEAVGALIRAIENLARARNCAAVQTMLPESDEAHAQRESWLVARFRRAGHEPRIIRACHQQVAATDDTPVEVGSN